MFWVKKVARESQNNYTRQKFESINVKMGMTSLHVVHIVYRSFELSSPKKEFILWDNLAFDTCCMYCDLDCDNKQRKVPFLDLLLNAEAKMSCNLTGK